MEKLEKQILIKGRKVLEDATKTELVNGKMEIWEHYARKMKYAIKCFLEMTEPLVEDLPDLDIKENNNNIK
jgi:hypothetical protein